MSNKRDTIYRYYKKLEEKGLILIRSVDKKDYISLTDKGKSWNEYFIHASDNLPNDLGQSSVETSDNHPTYHTTNTNHTTNDNKEPQLFSNSGSKTNQNTLEGRFLELFNTMKSHMRKTPCVTKRLSDRDLKNLKSIIAREYSWDDVASAIRKMLLNDWAMKTNNDIPAHVLVGKNFDRYFNESQKPEQNEQADSDSESHWLTQV